MCFRYFNCENEGPHSWTVPSIVVGKLSGGEGDTGCQQRRLKLKISRP